MLPPPARYTPFDTGTYDVRPGLRPLGFDFGNGPADAHLFQIDSEFPAYRQAKLEARRESHHRHVLEDLRYASVAATVTRFLAERLVAEHPQHFTLQDLAGERQLDCRLTGEVLKFDSNWNLDPDSAAAYRYVSPLDALACQVQEDFAITCVGGGTNRVAALHVCLPSHWRPEEKLGQNFAEVHAPVPGMEPFIQNQDKLVKMMLIAENGLVRFVWGLQWNANLNRHPDRCDAAERFTPESPNAFVRVERQTLWGLPGGQASLFTIRPYLIDARSIHNERQLAATLAAAIRRMSDESLRYKGLSRDRDRFLDWLEAPADTPK